MASLLPPTLSFHKPIKICPSLTSKRFSVPNPPCFKKGVSDFQSKSINFALSGALSLGLLFTGFGSADAKVGVNKPELLPRKYTPVIDIAGFLSTGQILIAEWICGARHLWITQFKGVGNFGGFIDCG